MIEDQIACGREPRCPRCGAVLEARPTTRLSILLPASIRGYDLDCRGCRKFHPRVTHTERSLHVVRLRHLAGVVLRA